LLASLGLLVLAPGTASAHTSLVASDPADRTIVEAAPETASLTFINRLDPRSVSLEVLALDGSAVGEGVRLTPDDPDAETVAFRLPDLDDGTYGLRWQAVGDDGHRVAGEIVIGVGASDDAALASQVDEAGFSSDDTVDRLLELGAGLSRSVWYLGLSLLVGGVFLLRWRLRTRRTPPDAPTGRQLHHGASYWSRVGVAVALGAALLGWFVVVAGRVRYFDEGSLGSRASDAVTSTPAMGWGLAALGILVLLPALGRLRQADANTPSIGRHTALVAALVTASGAWSVLAGHAAGSDRPALDLVSMTVHLLAATLWIGPIAVLSLVAVTSRWRRIESPERSRVLTAFFTDYANVALGAFLAVVGTGVITAWSTLGGRWYSNAYGWTLAIKAALVVAVVVPLALYHDRAARRSSDRAGSPSFLSSVRVEAFVLVGILGLAALLGGLTPGFDASEVAATPPADAAELFTDQAVADVGECRTRDVGQANCYRDYFRAVMVRDGADVAVAEVFERSATDEFVAADCHQITHDLGEDAVDHYDSLGEALAFEASACWSGYYHGVVETEMSQLDDEELLTTLPSVCEDAAQDRYSFTHYNCVHGVGHGLMLRFKSDLWTVIPYCETLEADPWEVRSCLGGSFMQNVVSGQEGETATFRDDDPLYPCTALAGTYREECLLMQTSWALHQSNYDHATVFALCDALPPEDASTCYQSMGRDISGGSLLDVATIVAQCDLGSETYRERCIVGASLNAVYNDHATESATALCEAVDQRWRQACLDARDQAASTF
jgi:copper transport protein